MKIVFMFPGQGSQYSGMGKDIYDEYEEVRNLYNKASIILEKDIAKLCFDSSKEELAKTENAQLAIAITSLGMLEVLKKHGIEAVLCTGLSLGEYVALMYSGVLSLEDGLKLLNKRGYCMANFIPDEEFAMAAVIGLESSKIEEMCTKLQNEGLFVTPANYNCSAQTVISGNKDAVEQASIELKDIGAKRVIALNTSGPFHTKKLEKAKVEYEKELEKVKFKKVNKMVLKNIDGTPYKETDNINEILANHIISPVRFDKTMEYMKEKGIDTFIEIGPGKAMTGFIKKEFSDLNISCFNTENLESLLNTIENCK